MAQWVPLMVACRDAQLLHVADSERTKPALQAKRAAGERLGKTSNLQDAGAAGRAVQKHSADRFAIGLLPILNAVRRSGAESLADIATALNDRGVRSAAGGKWYRSAVRNLLARAQSCEA